MQKHHSRLLLLLLLFSLPEEIENIFNNVFIKSIFWGKKQSMRIWGIRVNVFCNGLIKKEIQANMTYLDPWSTLSKFGRLALHHTKYWNISQLAFVIPSEKKHIHLYCYSCSVTTGLEKAKKAAKLNT